MSWSHIHGHDSICEQFRAAYRQGRMAHAYLFAGPHGIGKRKFAIELAKALLCESPPDILSACDHCSGCIQVEAETHPDCTIVRKPDDKLELPIDTIRELCGNLGLKPTRGSRKVAIIEDADDFNIESANAFLKSLEEPPPGTTLILLSSSPDSQLATIRSRCQVVNFAPLSARALEQILIENEVTDRERIKQLIGMAGGSAGQALALNDPAVWELRKALITAMNQSRFASSSLIEHWNLFIEGAGKESALQRLRAAVAVRILMDLLMRTLHLLLGADPGKQDPLEAEILQRFGKRLGVDGLIRLLDDCTQADDWIDRRVQLVLLTDWIIEKLSQAA